MESNGFQRAMLVVLGLYVLLSLAYISVTPYRTSGCLLSRMQDVVQQDIGAPDERQHTNYIRHLAKEKSLPVFDPESPNLYETYQSHQPPLYYLLATPVEMMVGGSEESEMWGLRLVNVFLGALVIFGIYTGIRRLTGSEAAGVAAAALTAFLPMFIALSSAVSNDMLLYLVVVATMNIIAIGWEKGWNLKRCLLLGIALGLGILTKTTAVVLVPVAIYGLLAKKDARPSARNVLALIGVAALISLPWLIRNQTLYGDPLAIGAFKEASVGNLAASVGIERAGGVLSYWFSFVAPTVIVSFWGVFGYFDVSFTQTIYWVCHILGLILLAAFGWSVVKRDDVPMRVHVLLILLFLMVLAAFVSYNANYFQAQGRYLYPAIFAIAGGFGMGLRKLAGSENRALALTAGIATIFVAINVYATFYLLPAAFEYMQRCVNSTPS